MNVLLFFLLIAAGEAAYFFTTFQQQTADGFQQQESAWQTQDDSLRDENKQLVAAKGDLEKAITAAEAEVNDLTGKLQAPTQNATTDAPGMAGGSPSAPATPPPAPPSLSLGAFTALDGQHYQNCQILKVEVDGVTFSHSEGITKVLGPNLPPDLQKRFEVDPTTGHSPDDVVSLYDNYIRQHTPAQPQ